jgi:hypothetical protein
LEHSSKDGYITEKDLDKLDMKGLVKKEKDPAAKMRLKIAFSVMYRNVISNSERKGIDVKTIKLPEKKSDRWRAGLKKLRR